MQRKLSSHTGMNNVVFAGAINVFTNRQLHYVSDIDEETVGAARKEV